MNKKNKDSKLVSIHNTDIISLILKEAKAYTSFELIESYISENQSLANIPVQPLYVSIRSLPLETRSLALSLMTKKQREIFYDLDLWKKDELDTYEFSNWVKAAAISPDDEVRYEFARGSEFALFLKGKFNVWTFDAEDPMYPDHDNYFLTEDNLLLVEYDEDCDVVDEVKNLIKDLYTRLGVEAAYQYLFIIVQDGFLNFSEIEYEQKKGRLREFGFVDYYDSLDVLAPLPSQGHVDLFIKNNIKKTAQLESVSKVQTLHKNSVVAFEKDHAEISLELSKVKDEDRFHYLHFNFVRLINANLEFHGLMKDGPMAMTRSGKKVKNLITLGLSYIRIKTNSKDSIFDNFDFIDVHRIGHSLTRVIQKKLKKELASYNLDEAEDKFLGRYFETFLEDTFSDEIMCRDIEDNAIPLTTYELLEQTQNNANLLISLLPFIKRFKDVLTELLTDGRLSNTFYLNYDMNTIDFEALMLSSFVNFSLGKFDKEDSQKMGVTISELKQFHKLFLIDQGAQNKLIEQTDKFISSFGLSEITSVDKYLRKLITDQLCGYEFNKLDDAEFKHVGGPIILNTLN